MKISNLIPQSPNVGPPLPQGLTSLLPNQGCWPWVKVSTTTAAATVPSSNTVVVPASSTATVTGGSGGDTMVTDTSGNTTVVPSGTTVTVPAGSTVATGTGSAVVTTTAPVITGPSLTITNSEATVQYAGVLFFAYSGFQPNSTVAIGIIGGPGIWGSGWLTDSTGSGSGAVTDTNPTGSYILLATDDFGHTATAPFTET